MLQHSEILHFRFKTRTRKHPHSFRRPAPLVFVRLFRIESCFCSVQTRSDCLMARGRGKGSDGGTGVSKKRPIERYEHTGKKRINNPPVGLVTPETDPPLPTHAAYDYVQPVPSVKPGKDLGSSTRKDQSALPATCFPGTRERLAST